MCVRINICTSTTSTFCLMFIFLNPTKNMSELRDLHIFCVFYVTQK